MENAGGVSGGVDGVVGGGVGGSVGAGSSSTMEQRMAASPIVPIVPIDLSNLSKDPAVLKAQLRQMEEDVDLLSRPPGDTKDREDRDMAERGMTRAERTQELSLREELARTAQELEQLSHDSIAEELRTRGVSWRERSGGRRWGVKVGVNGVNGAVNVVVSPIVVVVVVVLLPVCLLLLRSHQPWKHTKRNTKKPKHK